MFIYDIFYFLKNFDLYNFADDNTLFFYSPDFDVKVEEVEAAVKALKMGKSAGVDNIPAELVQAEEEAMIDMLTTICNKI